MATLEDVKNQDAPATKGAAFVQQVEQAAQFLKRYKIDPAGLSDLEILTKAENIKALSQSAAQVLSRGQVLDGLDRLLKTWVPKGFIGEFKRERDLDVQRAEALGWKVFIAEDKKKVASLTGAGDGRVRLGDLILMIMPEDNYAAHMIARERRKAKRREGRDPKKAGPQQGDELFGAHPDVPIVPL